ncbi:MAG: ethylbenzene dehydrogenase-related protein [Myxococcota bacterium]
MRVPHLPRQNLESVLDPDGRPWRGLRPTSLALVGTPLGLQPTDAIRATWATRKIGAVERVDVSAVHDGQLLAFRLEWSDPTENREFADDTFFPDAVAVLLPVAADAQVTTMGEPGKPVNAWYWRADEDGGRQVVAEGIGSSDTVDRELVRARGSWKGGYWRVVIARPLRVETRAAVAQLRSGDVTGFAVAVWDGGNGERAGIKSFSGDWQELSLDAEPTARS